MGEPRISVPPGVIAVATAIRGTVVGSSFQALRLRGLDAAYWAQIPAESEGALRALTAMSWVEMPLATVHYEVMDQLVRTAAEQRAMGVIVGNRVNAGFLKTLIRGLAAARVLTPWTVLERLPTLWSRVFHGGNCAFSPDGTKAAVVRSEGVPLFALPYCRNGWDGIWQAGMGMVVPTLEVQSGAYEPTKQAYTIRLTWK